MSVGSLLTYIWASRKARNATLLHGDQVRAWAQDAMHYAWDLFGSPLDPDLPYSLINGVDETSSCRREKKRYIIKISPMLATDEQRCAIVGHECYHRVTMKREGVRQEPWVDEMMAFLFSEWFLERQKFPYHHGRIRERYLKMRETVDMELLRDFGRTGEYIRVWREQSIYPCGFVSGVARVGLALNHLAERDAMCRVIEAEDWESWVESLSPDLHYAVRSILGMTTDGLRLPQIARVYKGYAYALKAVGRHEEAITQYEQALLWRPDDKVAHYQVGFSLRAVDRLEDARRAWEQAACFDPRNPAPAQNVASVYSAQKNYDRAITWLIEAVRRDPACVRAHYSLGKAYLAIGDPVNARYAWERMVALGEDEPTQEVRQFLENGHVAEE